MYRFTSHHRIVTGKGSVRLGRIPRSGFLPQPPEPLHFASSAPRLFVYVSPYKGRGLTLARPFVSLMIIEGPSSCPKGLPAGLRAWVGWYRYYYCSSRARILPRFFCFPRALLLLPVGPQAG